MKKLVFVIALVAILGAGTAFAADPRPDGLGIGIVGAGHSGWTGWGGFGYQYGLALAMADTYWGIRVGFPGNNIFVGVTGDFLTLLGGTFAGTPLGFYIDAGLFGNIWLGGDAISLGGGARLPIGLNLNFNIVDFWLAIVPSIGVNVNLGAGDTINIGGGWGPEIGVRVWF